MDKIQQKQENQYQFPYHHLANLDKGNFTQTKLMLWVYEYTSYIEFILDKIKQIDFSSLLDVGCGDGKLLYQASKIFTGKKLVGVDYSESSINLAKALNNQATYVCGDITDPRLFDTKYDIITLTEVLEHIPVESVSSFLAGIKYYLEDSGTLVITVPSKNIPLQAKHYQHFNLTSLENNLKPYFKIEKYYFLNRLSLSEKIIRRLFSNRLFILNQQTLLNKLYRLYKKKNLLGSDKDTKRICVFCKKV